MHIHNTCCDFYGTFELLYIKQAGARLLARCKANDGPAVTASMITPGHSYASGTAQAHLPSERCKEEDINSSYHCRHIVHRPYRQTEEEENYFPYWQRIQQRQRNLVHNKDVK